MHSLPYLRGGPAGPFRNNLRWLALEPAGLPIVPLEFGATGKPWRMTFCGAVAVSSVLRYEGDDLEIT